MSNFLLSIRNGLSKNSCTNVVSLDKSISEIKNNEILYCNMSHTSGQNWNGLVFKARSYSLIISLNTSAASSWHLYQYWIREIPWMSNNLLYISHLMIVYFYNKRYGNERIFCLYTGSEFWNLIQILFLPQTRFGRFSIIYALAKRWINANLTTSYQRESDT